MDKWILCLSGYSFSGPSAIQLSKFDCRRMTDAATNDSQLNKENDTGHSRWRKLIKDV